MITTNRFQVHSTVSLEGILNRQLRNASVLALEKGPVNGSVDVIILSNIRLFRFAFDKSIAIHAQRRPGNFFFSVDLSLRASTGFIRAQGVSLSRKALFGFNSNLKDLDLVLPSSSKMCTIVVPIDILENRLSEWQLVGAQKFLDRFNVLTNNAIIGSDGLISLLSECWNSPVDISRSSLEEDILSSLVNCLTDNSSRKVAPPLKRQDRHSAALGILSILNSAPLKCFEVQDLANLLHQSRTSLYGACLEKFGMSPVQVVRSVRLHQVRHALLDVEFCTQNDIQSVSDAAKYFGFASRSQFTKYYKLEFMETPGQTLRRRRNEEQFF